MENAFSSVMAERSNEELMEILLLKTGGYQVEALDAVRNELKNRNLSQEEIEAITDRIHDRKLEEQEKHENRVSWLESTLNYFRIPHHLPRTIKLAAWLIYLSLVVDGLRVYILNHQGIIHFDVDLATVLVTLLFLFVAYMIHTGKNWARLLFLTLIFTHLLLYPFYIASSFQAGMLFGVLLSISLITRLLALGFLFGRTGKAWYKKRYGTVSATQHLDMRKSVLSLVITLLFGAYMFRPVFAFFSELKDYSVFVAILVIIGDAILLLLIFFVWYGYIRRDFKEETGSGQSGRISSSTI